MNSVKGFKEVFSKKTNVILMLSFAWFFYLLSIIVTDFFEFTGILNNYDFLVSMKLVLLYFFGFASTIPSISAFGMLFISLLFGSYIALAVYQTRQALGEKATILGSVGVFLGILAPGCAACGLGAVSALGISAFIVSLPFKGIEISILSFLILFYANWKVAGKISQKVCPINVRNKSK